MDAGRPVPLSVDYVDASGGQTTGPGFVGDEGIVSAMWRVLLSR